VRVRVNLIVTVTVTVTTAIGRMKVATMSITAVVCSTVQCRGRGTGGHDAWHSTTHGRWASQLLS
jgi:hypothetical protein